MQSACAAALSSVHVTKIPSGQHIGAYQQMSSRVVLGMRVCSAELLQHFADIPCSQAMVNKHKKSDHSANSYRVYLYLENFRKVLNPNPKP